MTEFETITVYFRLNSILIVFNERILIHLTVAVYLLCPPLSARPPSPPSLVLMAPALPSGDKTTLVCLVQGFHPDGASLSWSDDSGSLTGAEDQKGESQRQPDGTYALSSLLSLPSTSWSSGQTFTCHLSHSALTNPLSRSVNNRQCSV